MKNVNYNRITILFLILQLIICETSILLAPLSVTFDSKRRDITSFVTAKAGKDLNKDVWWHYSGNIINVNSGQAVASIEGIERTRPMQNFRTIIPFFKSLNSSADVFRFSYRSEKTFVYTKYGNITQPLFSFKRGPHSPTRQMNPMTHFVEKITIGHDPR